MKAQDIPVKQVLDEDPKQYLELWKWFSEDAAKIKDKMWTMAAFFYTALGALLGYFGKQLNPLSPLTFDKPSLLLLVAFVGCLLSAYGIYMLHSYGKHIRGAWNRADYIRHRIKGLTEITTMENPDELKKEAKLRTEIPRGLPPVAKRMIGLMVIFLAAFLTLLILALNLYQKA